MHIAIIGCGLIGKRRAQIAHQSPGDEVVIVADVDESRAKAIATEIGCPATMDWQEVVSRDDLDAVVVATPNKYLMPVTVSALRNGKHVLCEKPPGRNFTETEQMVAAAKEAGKVLKVGFNHRHHPALWNAHELCERGEIGPLMFIRAVYGHGGRPGYDKEWRADAELSGGGELLDQGVHLVDLCRWFLGDFSEAIGFTSTYFWDLGYFPTTGHPPSATRHPSRGQRLCHAAHPIRAGGPIPQQLDAVEEPFLFRGVWSRRLRSCGGTGRQLWARKAGGRKTEKGGGSARGGGGGVPWPGSLLAGRVAGIDLCYS